jgi:hypothetical protein
VPVAALLLISQLHARDAVREALTGTVAVLAVLSRSSTSRGLGAVAAVGGLQGGDVAGALVGGTVGVGWDREQPAHV